MLSSAVFQGIRASTWNMYEASRLRPSVSGCPKTLIVPEEGFIEPRRDVQKRGLPASGRADDREELALADRHVDVAHGRVALARALVAGEGAGDRLEAERVPHRRWGALLADLDGSDAHRSLSAAFLAKLLS